MKKIISLLLVLVLALGMLSGISMAADAEMPLEVAQADAGVKVTDSKGDTYYFETLSQEVTAWTMQMLSGPKTIEVLKDLELDDSTGNSQARYLNIEGTLAKWYERSGSKHPLIFDFGGHTVTYTGTGNFFFAERFGFTVKNGTLIYNGTENRCPITVGTSKGHTAITAGTTLWQPEINVENMTIVNTNEKGGWVVANYVHGLTLNIENSTLWSTKWTALELNASTQESLNSGGVPYEGDFMANVTIENSIVGATNGYAFEAARDEYAITIVDSLLVSNGKAETMYDEATDPDIDTKGMDIVPLEGWTGEVNGTAVSGNAYAVGTAPGEEPLPFTDVAETDWFYEFVKELYGKKIVAGQTETTFNPGGNLTYAAALKLLVVGLTGKDAGNAASGHWATNYLDEAKAAGWTDIDAAKLDSPITREAFCEIAAKAKNLTEQPETNAFTDTANTSVLALVKAGVINGMNETTFQPAGILTRAQISKIISLLLKL